MTTSSRIGAGAWSMLPRRRMGRQRRVAFGGMNGEAVSAGLWGGRFTRGVVGRCNFRPIGYNAAAWGRAGESLSWRGPSIPAQTLFFSIF